MTSRCSEKSGGEPVSKQCCSFQTLELASLQAERRGESGGLGKVKIDDVGLSTGRDRLAEWNGCQEVRRFDQISTRLDRAGDGDLDFSTFISNPRPDDMICDIPLRQLQL